MLKEPLLNTKHLKRLIGSININRSFITVLGYAVLIFIIIYLLFFRSSTIVMEPNEFYAALKPQCPALVCPTNQNGTVVSPQTQQAATCLNENDNLLEKAYERKYIGCNFWAVGGIGNQIWRFSSLYGLGRFTGRHPYFEARNPSQMENLMEIAEVFPMMHEVLQVKNPPDSIIKKYHFADDCCKYDDPKKLLGLPEKYVKIAGDYMQSYKFFHPYRDELRKVLECGPTKKVAASLFAKDLFKDDTSFKLCAYIRRGDFLTDLMLESKEDFTIPALQFAHNFIKEKENNKRISITFIGNDHDFIKKLNLSHIGFDKIYMPDSKTRGEDMCFGINHCDSMVLTASGSTFGWWISYLMKPSSTIFYNAQITDHADFTKDVHDFDIFPPDWVMLTVKDGKAEKETKWWYQRRNQPQDLPPPTMQPWT